MAYGGYRGRCLGRQMQFLYKVTSRSDSWCLGHNDKGQSCWHDGPDSARAQLMATVEWEPDTDIPVFTFYGENAKHYADQFERIKPEVIAQDGFQGVFTTVAPHSFFQVQKGVGFFKMTLITLIDTKNGMTNKRWEVSSHPQPEWRLTDRLQFFRAFPPNLEIRDTDGTVIGTVADMMVYRWREDVDGPLEPKQEAA